MNHYWFHPGGQTQGPYFIQVTVADSPCEACTAFGEPFPSPCVHVLGSPSLKRLLHFLLPGMVHIHRAETLPSARDYFTENGYR